MKQLPLPVRVAAGLAVTAVDQARHLPEKLAELPVTVVSQALQLSMRVQQQLTELAIKGDDALASFRPVEETPGWARFDEDEAPEPDNGRSAFDLADDHDLAQDQGEPDPWTAEQEALSDEHAEGEFDSAATFDRTIEFDRTPEFGTTLDDTTATETAETARQTETTEIGTAGPVVLPNYAELSLPQLRARLRRLTEDELAELVEYEHAHGNRADYVGMLNRRIATLRARQ
jgi:hypothetical protein